MANSKFEVYFDNRVKPGDTSCGEIISELASQGIAAQAAEPVRDPISGKLIKVNVHLPDTANAQATTAIDGNSGVAVATLNVPLPPQALVSDVTNITYPSVLSGDTDGGNWDFFSVTYSSDAANATVVPAGRLRGDGVSAIYEDFGTNPDLGLYKNLTIQFANWVAGSPALVINDGDVVITTSSGSITLQLSAPISVPAPTTPGYSSTRTFFVDAAGRLYDERYSDNNVLTLGPLSFQDAVNRGAK